MLYIFDKDENLLEVITKYSNESNLKKLNSERSFKFDVDENINIKKYNKVGIFDRDNNFQLFEIYNIEKYSNYKEKNISVFCIHDFYSLKKILIDDKRATTINEAIHKCLENSDYKVGTVESFEDRNINFYHISRLKALNEILNTFKCEFDIRIEIDKDTGKIKNKFIDLKHRLGIDTGLRFTFDTALNYIEKTIIEDGHFNVLWGFGKALETENGGFSRKLDFAAINNGKKYIEDLNSIERYGRLEGKFEDNEIEDQYTLLETTKKKLQDTKNLKVSYKATIEDIRNNEGFEHYKVNLGDTIIIEDDEIIEARIIEIEELNDEILLTLGNFLLGLSDDTIDDALDDLKDKIDNISPDINNPETIFPDTLPKVPMLEAQGLFSSVILSWSYENKLYYTYEVFASKISDFMPDSTNRIFEGKASSFLHEVKPAETWYYRCRAKNTYDNGTDYSTQVEATTKKIADGTEWFEELAITHALIGSLDADKIVVGKLKAQFLELYNLLLTDGNGKETLRIDDFGRVNLDVNTLKILNKKVINEEEVQAKINVLANNINLTVQGLETDIDTITGEVNVVKESVNRIDINVDNITLATRKKGIANICQNPRPRQNLTNWYASCSPNCHFEITTDAGSENYEGETFKSGMWCSGLRVPASESGWCLLGNDLKGFKFNVNKTYTYDFYFYTQNYENITVQIANGDGTHAIFTSSQYHLSPHKYHRITGTFTTGANPDNPQFRIMYNSQYVGQEIYTYVPYVNLYEGDFLLEGSLESNQGLYEGKATFDENGLKYEFEDATWSQMGRDGFRYWKNGMSKPYQYITFTTKTDQLRNGYWTWVNLPDFFRGKVIDTDFKVTVSVEDIDCNAYVTSGLYKGALRNFKAEVGYWESENCRIQVRCCIQKIGLDSGKVYGWDDASTDAGAVAGESAAKVIIQAQM